MKEFFVQNIHIMACICDHINEPQECTRHDALPWLDNDELIPPKKMR